MASGYPDYEGGKSKIYSVGEWAVLNGDDVHVWDNDGPIASGNGVLISHTTTAGKVFYVVRVSAWWYASNAADRDLNQIGGLIAWNSTVAGAYVFGGGHGGVTILLTPAIPVPANQTYNAQALNRGNHNMEIAVSMTGYEV